MGRLGLVALAIGVALALTIVIRLPGLSPASATGGNSITAPDISPAWETSLALDSSGNPVVAYRTQVNDGPQDLKLLRCGDPACSKGNSIATPDSALFILSPSLALDSSGNPVVSYYHRTNFDLRVLHCGNPTCTEGNVIASPDTAGDAGYLSSLALDAAGNPVVAYFDFSNDALKVLHCGDPTCSSGNVIAVVDGSGNVGFDTSLAVGPDGIPVVAYLDPVNRALKVLRCGDTNCTAGNVIATLDSGNVGLIGLSLVLDAAGNPVVSYLDDAENDLNVLHCGDPTCSSGNTIASPDTPGTGWDSSVVLDAAGNPVVSYYASSGQYLKVLHCGNPTCTSGNTIAVGDDSGFAGQDSSIGLDASGNPVVSYRYFLLDEDALRVLHCATASCTGAKPTATPCGPEGCPTATATVTSTITPTPTVTPIPLPRDESATIAAGALHTCALTAVGGVQCWGSNIFGQLGAPTTDSCPFPLQILSGALFPCSRVPVPVTGLTSGVVAIAAGDLHTCALTASGGVKCWGLNVNGQLGDGLSCFLICNSPVDVVGLQSGVVAIAAGGPGPIGLEFGSADPFEASFAGHTCALTESGEVLCWGSNTYWQAGPSAWEICFDLFGPDEYPCSTVPVQVPVDETIAIAAGGLHSCALLATGGVQCWGDNASGQLGANRPLIPSPFPVAVAGLNDGIDIAAGGFHSCAVTSDGRAKCWGANDNGQLGDGTTAMSPAPVEVCQDYGEQSCEQPLDGVSSLAAGGGLLFEQPVGHTCALTTTGLAKCWGFNLGGQIGDGTTQQRDTPAESLVGVPVSTIALGLVHSCAVTTASPVLCWGSNDSGQLGAQTAVIRTTPLDVLVGPDGGLLTGVSAIRAGGEHTCSLTVAGFVQCWGLNSFGQLGDGTETSSSFPVEVLGLSSGDTSAAGQVQTCSVTTTDVVECLAAGTYQNCVFTTAGVTRCWGNNPSGQLGVSATGQSCGALALPCSRAPITVSELTNDLIDLASGFAHTCAVTVAGATKCWGDDFLGQLGDGPGGIAGPPGDMSGGWRITLTGALAVTCRAAIEQAGTDLSMNLDCGRDGSGTLIGTIDAGTGAFTMSGLVLGFSIDVDGTASQDGRSADGVWSSSSGFSGTFDSTRTATPHPLDVVGLTGGAAAVTAGHSHTCALTAAGGAKCWGSNQNGQLGDGTTIDRFSPVDVTGLSSGVLAIAAGDAHTCALTAVGAVKCWGNNQNGQLGDGTTVDRVTPVDVTGLSSGVKAIAAGPGHTCALTEEGGIKCWGNNTNGELGDGQVCGLTCTRPADVLGLETGVKAVSAGGGVFGSHTCALLAPGTVKCWGYNLFGQLGIGESGISTVPIIVRLAGEAEVSGFAGDGGDPLTARLNDPHGVSETTSGAVYFADSGNCRIRKLEGGTIDTVAGSGTPGVDACAFGGDNGAATVAKLNGPRDVFVASSGDFYIADTENCRIRKVSGGVITTFAGNGTCGYGGDGGPAASAQLDRPSGVYVDATGVVYIADTENCRVRKVSTGTITTVAGTGDCSYGGDGGPATSAKLNRPHDVYGALPGDDLLIADTDNHRIRHLNFPAGTIRTIAGTGVAGYGGDDGPPTSAQLNAPEALTAANYRILIADTQNHRVREVNTLANVIVTVAGNGTQGSGGDGGPATQAQLDSPAGVAGTLIVSDTGSHTIRASGAEAEGPPTPSIVPTQSCAILPNFSSIDWALPAALLALVFVRRRVGQLFFQLRDLIFAARRPAPTPSKPYQG